jgi:hypothetical protein
MAQGEQPEPARRRSAWSMSRCQRVSKSLRTPPQQASGCGAPNPSCCPPPSHCKGRTRPELQCHAANETLTILGAAATAWLLPPAAPGCCCCTVLTSAAPASGGSAQTLACAQDSSAGRRPLCQTQHLMLSYMGSCAWQCNRINSRLAHAHSRQPPPPLPQTRTCCRVGDGAAAAGVPAAAVSHAAAFWV